MSLDHWVIPIEFGMTPPSPETIRKVQLYVCGRYEVDDAKLILDALGLIPEPK